MQADSNMLDEDGGKHGEAAKRCGEKCQNPLERSLTAEKHSLQTESYACGSCNASFKTLRSLKKHNCLLTQHDCNNQDERKREQVHKKHGREPSDYADSEPNIHKCAVKMDECRREEARKEQYRCSECPKAYSKKHFLTKHLVAAHNGKMPWRCSSCGEKFASSIRFKEHCKEHGIEKPFQCEKCQSFFSSAEVLRVHDRTHTGERPFDCETCGKSFKQNSNLQDHVRKHKNDRSFICGNCGKSFNLKGDLTKHLLLHTGERKHHCQFCSKAFPGSSNLKRHIRIHTGVKPFTCSYCQKSFPRKERLNQHERTHTGERPFVCLVCGKTFSDSGNFSNHKKGHEDADLKKWRRFPKKNSSVSSAQSTASNYSFEVDVGNEGLKRLDSSSSVPPAQSQKIVFALAGQVACYFGDQEAVPIVGAPGAQINHEAQHEKGGNQMLLQWHTLSGEEASRMDLSARLQPDKEVPFEETSARIGSMDSSKASNTCRAGAADVTADASLDKSDAAHKPEGALVSFDPVTSSGNVPFSDSFLLSESTSGIMLTPTKILPALRPYFEEGFQKIGSLEKKMEKKDSNVTQDKTSPVSTESDGCKSLNVFSSSGPGIMNDVTDNLCASSLTLIDLSKADDVQSYSCQSGYVMLHDEDGSQRQFAKILLATPTKSYPEENTQSPNSLISSQVLVTPEHASLPRQMVDRARVKPRVLEL